MRIFKRLRGQSRTSSDIERKPFDVTGDSLREQGATENTPAPQPHCCSCCSASQDTPARDSAAA
jgi:hypothetical protein